MRKITREAAQAFEGGCEFTSGNTTVRIDSGDIRLLLHNNMIAIRHLDDDRVRVTTAGWNTNTTRERLNGLDGVKVNVTKGQLYLNGTEWNGDLK